MPAQMTDEEIRNKAKERVLAKKGFLIHLAVYIAVNIFLWIVWWITNGGSSGYMWPVFPSVGWGIAIVIHFFTTFTFHGNWEDREVEKEIERIKKSGGSS